ncbi:MAG: L-rhamnonate dehydratase [Anaerolineae bacterium]|nr:L-rhamnonate dehydratase [Anaerolineae bacterium]
MKIRAIEVFRLKPPKREFESKARRPPWTQDAEVANPMSKFPEFKRHRSLWLPRWETVWVKVTAEDGTFGLGPCSFGRPVASIIEDHFAPKLIGQDALAIEKIWDMMFRMSKPYGTVGLASVAMSGVDLALWDLAGKLHGCPVYELLGGPARERIFTYATGNDTDWQLELGFKAVKLACPYGPADGLWGLQENEKLVARTRELVGDDVEIMLDCYMAFDVEYTVRLAERLRPYRLKWIEEYLIPEDLDGHVAVRQRLPWQTLATGEHMYTPWPFRQLIERRAVDILQPDIFWVGGLTACRHIAEMANSAGITVILHGGGNSSYGQHFTYAMPNTPWAEYFVGSPPGVPLEEATHFPGTPVPVDGWLVPNDGPGFGVEIPEEWLEPFFA